MIKIRHLAFLTIFVPTYAFAQNGIFKDNWYVELKGTQGDTPLILDLTLTDGNRVVGKSCPSTHENELSYDGQLNNQDLSVNVLSEDNLVGQYTLTPLVNSGYVSGYIGQYEDEVTGETQSVDLRYSKGSYGKLGNRYVDFPGTDTELEAFARNIIDAFLSEDKQWLSENIYLPFRFSIEEGHIVEIKSSDEFLQNYDSIATQTLLEKLPSFPTCNLWSNHSGAALGGGEIWIWRDDASTDEAPIYLIRDVVSY